MLLESSPFCWQLPQSLRLRILYRGVFVFVCVSVHVRVHMDVCVPNHCLPLPQPGFSYWNWVRWGGKLRGLALQNEH